MHGTHKMKEARKSGLFTEINQFLFNNLDFALKRQILVNLFDVVG
jgi:hypothetical protein